MPKRENAEPPLHQQAGGREFRSERHRPIEPVQHGDGEGGAGADEPLRIQVEAAGIRHGHRQFAETEHDEIYEHGADAVCDDRAKRPRLMNRVAGAQEQARADYAAQRDHGQMTGLHLAFEPALLAFDRGFVAASGLHGHSFQLLACLRMCAMAGRIHHDITRHV